MVTDVTCPVCQKHYSATPDMIGKRVRCRNCATVFPVVPQDAGSLEPVGVSTAEEDLALAAPPPPPPMEGGLESEFETAFSDEEGHRDLRQNIKLKFPWAAELDRFLPATLIVIAVVWICAQTFRSPDLGPIWAGFLRVGVVFALFACLIVPVVMFAAGRIARKLKYELPPGAPWRAAAVFSLPLMLGYVFWTVSEGLSGFVLGCVLGLLISAAAFWLLFRLQPKEIAPSFAAAGGGFIGAVLVSIGIMALLNVFINSGMISSHSARDLHSSPLGPGFAWNAGPDNSPARPDQNQLQMASSNGSNPVAPTTQQSTAANNDASSLANGEHPTTSSSDPSTAAQVATSGSAVKVTSLAAPVGSDNKTSSLPTDPTSPAVSTESGGSKVFDLPADALENSGSADDAWLASVRSKAVPFIASVQAAKGIAPSDAVIYPATTSGCVAVVHHKDEGRDLVQVVDAQGRPVGPDADLPREGNGIANGREYALSPDGQMLARPVHFPRAGFAVWMIPLQRSVAISPECDAGAVPQLVGFCDNDKLVLEYAKNKEDFIDVWSIKENRSLRSMIVPFHPYTPGNCEISPDGQYVALAARVDGKAALEVYSLTADRMPQDLVIKDLDPHWVVQPAGIAFSGDSSKVAILFVERDEGFIESWNLKNKATPPNEQLCTAIPVQVTRNSNNGGRVLDWIGDGTWLIGGDAVMDVATGRLLGRIGDNAVRGQHVEGNRVEVLYSMNRSIHVADLRLDQAKVASMTSGSGN